MVHDVRGHYIERDSPYVTYYEVPHCLLVYFVCARAHVRERDVCVCVWRGGGSSPVVECREQLHGAQLTNHMKRKQLALQFHRL